MNVLLQALALTAVLTPFRAEFVHLESQSYGSVQMDICCYDLMVYQGTAKVHESRWYLGRVFITNAVQARVFKEQWRVIGTAGPNHQTGEIYLVPGSYRAEVRAVRVCGDSAISAQYPPWPWPDPLPCFSTVGVTNFVLIGDTPVTVLLPTSAPVIKK